MNAKIVVHEKIPAGWGEFLEDADNASVMHTPEFLRFMEDSGYSLSIISAEASGIVAALPALAYKKMGASFLTYYPLAGYDSVINRRGHDETGKLLEHFAAMSKKKDVVYADVSDFSGKLGEHAAYLAEKGFMPKKENTYILDIGKPDDMWEAFDRKVRNSVRKAQKNLTVEEVCERKQVEALYPLFTETARKHGIRPYPLRRYLTLLDVPAGRLRWLTAKQDEKYVATSVYWTYKDKVTYGDNASAEEHKSLFGSDLLTWELLNWATKKGYVSIDLGGAPDENEGLRRFKDKWGARRVEYNSYVKKTRLYGAAYGLRGVLKKFVRVH